jgi:YesN/AraC family two-component response regulator
MDATRYIEVECPDIIVTDVIMPDCNCFQLAKATGLKWGPMERWAALRARV